jgi:hypothetical protein
LLSLLDKNLISQILMKACRHEISNNTARMTIEDTKESRSRIATKPFFNKNNTILHFTVVQKVRFGHVAHVENGFGWRCRGRAWSFFF